MTTSTSSSSPGSFKPSASGSKALEAGIAREWCHSYDLTKSMNQQLLQGAPLQVTPCASSSSSSSSSRWGAQTSVAAAAAQVECTSSQHEGGGSTSAAFEMLRGTCADFLSKHRQAGPIPGKQELPLIVNSIDSIALVFLLSLHVLSSGTFIKASLVSLSVAFPIPVQPTRK